MSIYTQLLDTALGQIPSTEEELTPGEALTELFRCRTVLGAGLARTGSNWAPAAVANELAYDIALIELARSLGVACDVSRFDRPGHERARLERELAARGIRLVQSDETESA
jgi:hypothetical protein